MIGDKLDNQIIGNDGDDVIDGGGGNDVIEGGSGADEFIISENEGITTITDYSLNEDSIYLDFDDFDDFIINQIGKDVVLTNSGNDLAKIENIKKDLIVRKNNKIIALEDDYSESFKTKGNLIIGANLNGDLEIKQDKDWVKVDLKRNTNYKFDLIGDTLQDPYLTLFDNSGRTILSNDDGGIKLNSQIMFTPSINQDYYLGISSFNSEYSGTYNLIGEILDTSFSENLFSNFSKNDGFGLVSAKKAFEDLITIDIPEVNDLGGNLWGLDNIDIPEIWAKTYKKDSILGEGVTIAVVDTGIDLDHKEFKGRVVNGYDFVDDDIFADDLHGHGTHVAGTIAAANDSKGITGVAYNSKIMPIRVLDENGRGYLSDVARGIRFAADNGADVINLSLGGGGHSRRLYESIKYASNLGSVVVMASGNSGLEMPSFPAIYSMNYGISVGAVDINNNMARFSNKSGNYFLDYVTAPGVNIFSTVPNDGYAFYSGTSMAAPHVAGIAALLKSYDKGLTTNQIESLIIGSGSNNNYYDFESYLLQNNFDVLEIYSSDEEDMILTLDNKNLFKA